MFSRFIHVVSLGQNFVPLYGLVKLRCMGLSCILFIHSSVDGHLWCFHILAIASGTATNIRVQDFLLFWAYTQGWHGWIREATELFSTVATALRIPTSKVWGSSFSTFSPMLLFFWHRSQLSGCDVESHCGLPLHGPDGWRCWASFPVLIAQVLCCLWGKVDSSPSSIFKWGCLSFVVELLEFFMFSGW